MKPKVIAQSGAHGTGKTTATLELALRLKRTSPELSVGIVQNIARRCPGPINKQTTEDAQLWIFSTQLQKEIQASIYSDIVVCDRTLFDHVAYAFAAGFDTLSDRLLSIAEHRRNAYSQIVFHCIDDCNALHSDGIRETEDHDFRQRIEDELIGIYEHLKIDYTVFKWQ